MNDFQFKALLGVENKVFQFTCKLVEKDLKEPPKLSKRIKVAIVCMKLKLNISFQAIAALFAISRNTCRRWFNEALPLMSESSKKIVHWLPDEVIKARLPPSFQALFPDTTCIMDAFETFIERPSDHSCEVCTYSSYKGHCTLKVNITIAPHGKIMHLSKGFGGRSTDCQIVTHSGVIKKLGKKASVMADRGYPHIEADLNSSGNLLVMPPFKMGSDQFSEEENDQTYKVASVRIHVERGFVTYMSILVFKLLAGIDPAFKNYKWPWIVLKII